MISVSVPQLVIGRVHPWVGLGWIEILKFLMGWVGLGWVKDDGSPHPIRVY